MLCRRHGNKSRKCFGNFNLRHPSKNAASVRWSIAPFIRIITILHHRSVVAPTVVFSRRTREPAMLSDFRRRHRHRHRRRATTNSIGFYGNHHYVVGHVLSCAVLYYAPIAQSRCPSVFLSVQFYFCDYSIRAAAVMWR